MSIIFSVQQAFPMLRLTGSRGYTHMSRIRSCRRWTVAALLAGLAGIGTAGCIAVPVGGYDSYPGAYGGYGGGYGGYSVAGPAIVVPAPVIAPSIVIAPGSRGIRGRGPARSYGRGPSGSHRRG